MARGPKTPRPPKAPKKKLKEQLFPAPEPIVAKFSADDLRKMDPDKRARLEANLIKAEQNNSRPEQTNALRASFNEMRQVRNLRALARERLKK